MRAGCERRASGPHALCSHALFHWRCLGTIGALIEGSGRGSGVVVLMIRLLTCAGDMIETSPLERSVPVTPARWRF